VLAAQASYPRASAYGASASHASSSSLAGALGPSPAPAAPSTRPYGNVQMAALLDHDPALAAYSTAALPLPAYPDEYASVRGYGPPPPAAEPLQQTVIDYAWAPWASELGVNLTYGPEAYGGQQQQQ
jgi:hypothetical protein